MGKSEEQDKVILDVVSLIDNNNGDSNYESDIETADKLDTIIAVPANEKEPTASMLEKFKQTCVSYEQTIDELAKENNDKVAANWRNKEALRDIGQSKWISTS